MSDRAYITGENADDKVASWREELRPYSHRRKRFLAESSALLVIDMQRYFLEPKSHAYVASSAVVVERVRPLLDFYRDSGCPVIFTYFAVREGEEDSVSRWWEDSVSDGSMESRISDSIKPLRGEKIIRKRAYDAFFDTDLESYLKQREIESVVITGVLTNLCCETTARSAFCRDFDVFFVMDATAAYTEEMHIMSLKNLSYGFATPVASSDIIL